MARRWTGLAARRAQRAVLKADKVCMVCGSERKLGVHHIVPCSDGGSDRARNLITTCDTCEKQIHKKTFDIIHQGGIAIEYPSHRIYNIYLLRELMRGEKRPQSKTFRADYLARRAVPKFGKNGEHPDKLSKSARNLAYMIGSDTIDRKRLPWMVRVGDLSVEIKEVQEDAKQ